MRALTFVLVLVGVCLAAQAPVAAQEGHPLKGSWVGTWGPSQNHTDDVLILIRWDGKALSGMINPGTDNIPIKNASLTPQGWLVHLEGDGKDKSGKVITYVIDGKIENLGLPHRSVVGTWKTQNESGPFKITRQ
jgi:hypothetical protein